MRISHAPPAVIARELRSVCIPPNLLGYHYLLYAVEKVALDPLRIKGLTKDLYSEIAQQYQTTPGAVDRNIRTAISTGWTRGAKETLDKMAGYHLIERPFASEFIAVVAAHVAKQCT